MATKKKVTKKTTTKKTTTKKKVTTKAPKAKAPAKPTPAVKEEEACVWQISNNCSNTLTRLEMFNHQIRVPICTRHAEEHAEIMLLHKNGYDVEEILNQTAEWRKQEVLTLKLSGLDKGDVPL
jgi:hypothetical protein